MPDRLDDFPNFRAELNDEILACRHLRIRRFFALDHQAYEPGPLGTKTKELLGLVASAVLRCNEAGSITIPHVRRAFARMREIDG